MKHLMFIMLLLILSIPCQAQESQKSYTLLLLPFEDRSGIENPLLEAFNDTIDFVLSRQTGPVVVRLIPKADRDALLARMARMQPDKSLLEQALLVAEWAAADGLITGSYTKQGEKWSLQAEVYHLREGRKARQPIQIQGDSVYNLLDDFPQHLLKQFKASYIALTTDSWKAYEEFRQGQKAFNRLNYLGALEHYDKALQLDPTLALAYAEQSRVYLITGQPEKVTTAIEAAKQLIPKASPIEKLAIRALAHSLDAEQDGYEGWATSWGLDGKRHLLSLSDAGNLANLASAGIWSANLAPGGIWNEALIHLSLAFACMREGERAEADQHNEQWFKAIQQRIRAYPDNVSLLHATATYCLVIGKHVDEAIDMELKAIELNPKEDWLGRRYVLSRLYELQGDIQQMLKWATESVQHLPDPRPREGYWFYLWHHLATSLHEGKIPPERLLRWCEDVLRMPKLHQLYRVRTQYLMVEIYHAMNNDLKRDAMLASIGAPRESDWMVIGPFDTSESIITSSEDLFPETPPFALCTNLTASHMGILDREMRWESWQDDRPLDGLLDMGTVFNKKYYGTSDERSDQAFPIPAIVYSCIYVAVPTAVEVQVRTGVLFMKAWLDDNPSPVIEVIAAQSSILDGELTSVSLAAGLNRFLVATVSGIDSFSFYFRITDYDGNPIPGLRYVSMREALKPGFILTDEDVTTQGTSQLPRLTTQEPTSQNNKAVLDKQSEEQKTSIKAKDINEVFTEVPNETTTTSYSKRNQKDGAEMVYIPAGEFMMGSDTNEINSTWQKFGWDEKWKQYAKDESPKHRVYVDGFWMYKYEVTVAQYRQFCQETERQMPEAPNWEWQHTWGWQDNHPIVNVTWDDALAYCQWAGVRLPTEAEWEYAARGGNTGLNGKPGYLFVWGDELPKGKGGYGNFADDSLKTLYPKWMWTTIEGYDDGYVDTAPVGSFNPNGFGLYDMAGNVWEWCADWYDDNYYASALDRNPQGPSSGTAHIIRGGSWNNSFINPLRVAYRNSLYPSPSEGLVGFRCVRASNP